MAHTSSVRKAQSPSCPFCGEEKVTNWACLGCEKLLCDTCRKVHLQIKTQENHEIINAKDFAGHSTELKLISGNCQDHKGDIYTNYCANCNKLVCLKCLADNTESHKDHTLHHIKKFYSDKTKELQKCRLSIVEDILPTIHKKIETISFLEGYHDKNVDDQIQKIRKQEKKIKEKVSEIADMHITKLQEHHRINKETISSQKIKLSKTESELNSMAVSAELVMLNKNVVRVKELTEDIAIRIKESEISLSFPQAIGCFTNGNIVSDELALMFGFLNWTNAIKTLRFNVSKHIDLKSLSCRDGQSALAIKQDGSIYISRSFSGLVCISRNEEEPKKIIDEYGIVDIAFTNLDELVISFRNNIRLQRHDGELVTLYDTEKNYVLAVHCCSNNCIMILTTSNEYFGTNVFEAKSNFISETMIELNVKILSKSGNINYNILCNGDYFVRVFQDEESDCKIFNETTNLSINKFRITESVAGNFIFTSSYQDQLSCLDYSGNVKWVHKIKHPVDLTTTSLGNIVVCSHQFWKGSEFSILDAEGTIYKTVKLKELNITGEPLELYLTSYRKLSILCSDKIYFVELSTDI